MNKIQSGKTLTALKCNIHNFILILVSGAPAPHNDKSKDWQLEILMEKLRSKASQFKTLAEISKNVRMTLLVR